MKYQRHYVGEKIGKLTIIEELKEKTLYNSKKWKCKCDCGKIKIIDTQNLRVVRSCGCLKKKHGLSTSKIYATWQRIKNRCYKKNYPHYQSYGGRGIKVCDEWLDKKIGFINFYNWAMNNGYKENLSIDRINVNGDYCPENCRWITMKEQASNKRTNIFYTINGKTMTQTQWAKYYNIPLTNLRRRLSSGWDIEDALTKPIKKWR